MAAAAQGLSVADLWQHQLHCSRAAVASVRNNTPDPADNDNLMM